MSGGSIGASMGGDDTDRAADPSVVEPLTLRPWRSTDALAVLAIFAASDDLATQYPLPVTDVGQAEDCLARMLVWDDTRKNFAIVPTRTDTRHRESTEHPEEPRPVGNVAVTAIEYRHRTGWVSYFSSGAHRGRGLVGRSVAALSNWALDPAGLGLERLELGHRLNNPGSGSVARRAGFVREGTERAKLRYGGERFDVATYGRLRSDALPEEPTVTIQLS